MGGHPAFAKWLPDGRKCPPRKSRRQPSKLTSNDVRRSSKTHPRHRPRQRTCHTIGRSVKRRTGKCSISTPPPQRNVGIHHRRATNKAGTGILRKKRTAEQALGPRGNFTLSSEICVGVHF